MSYIFPEILTNIINEDTPDNGVTIDNVLLKDGIIDYLKYVQNIKNNYTSMIPPTANDDSSLDYSVGSIWLDNASNRSYICLDSTNAASLWRDISSTGSFITYPEYITVGPAGSGADYNTIEAALIAANALIPSENNPIGIKVFPGIYVENNPLNTIEYVDINSVIGQHVTIVKPNTTTAEIFNVVSNVNLQGLTITGANGVGGIGAKIVSVTSHGHVRDCTFYNCETCIKVTGANVYASIHRIHIHQQADNNIINAIEVSNGACAVIHCTDIFPNAGTSFTKGVYVDGANTTLHLFNSFVESCTDGLYVSNTAHSTISAIQFNKCINAIHTAISNGGINMVGVEINNSTTYDIYSEGTSDTFIHGSGNKLLTEKISVTNDSIFNIGYASITEGYYAFHVTGEFSVGSYQKSSESSFGQGDSYIIGMSVFRNTNLEVGTWSDVTNEAKYISSGTFNIFPNVTANNTIYVGGNNVFPGIKTELTVAITLGSGSIAWEYWNGVIWKSFNLTSAMENNPFTQYAENTFSIADDLHIRFGTMTGWATKNLNGTTKYWIRCRIVTDIIISPTAKRIKQHTDHTEINKNGTILHFGAARPSSELIPQSVSSTPSN